MLYNIGYMVASKCRVISISVGSTDPSPVSSDELEIAASYDALVQKLEEAGYDFLIMKSAGNSTRDASNYQLNRVMTTGTIQDAVTDNLINDAGVLDSHLVGPTPYGSRFHIYYSDKNYYYNGRTYVNLDVDDTSSYGPETISVYVGVNGKYTYHVHDYSNGGSSYSTALANPGAQVKVYVGGTNEYYEFYVPNYAGTIWEVFSFKNGVLTPINYMTYGSASYMPS